MVQYLEGVPRNQIYLFSECLDDIIEEDNIVRFIDAYVESLDLEKLGFKVPSMITGAPPYRSQLKLKIYIYGYLERIRSSRRLEKECRRNTELMWLTENLAPDFKTIADFRRDNLKALKNLFKEFLKLCHKMELISFKTVAIDGTKMRGQNSLNEVYRKNLMDHIEKEIQAKIDSYLDELNELDKIEQNTGISVNKEKLQMITSKLDKQLSRKNKIDYINRQFITNPDNQIYYATDSDCRLQSDKGKIRPGYNPQTAVDEKNKLIVVVEVTNEQSDQKQLTPMLKLLKKQKEELGIEGKTTSIADTGYYSEKEILYNKDNEDFSVVVSPLSTSKKDGNEIPKLGYRIENFVYDGKRDVYICPENKELRRVSKTTELNRQGRLSFVYQCDPKYCYKCPKRQDCTTNKKGRKLRISVNQKEIQRYIDGLKTKENRNLINKRKEIVEHPFGTIKRTLGYTYFQVKGIEKVQGEFSFICFIYNLKRVLNIIGIKEMIKALA
ncbi:MAG: IS1182 family transposase [Candidatus Delongbacteria bacterium]|nr:IS1182 family transposase [Candidatus Delongbacteria bacterium]